VTEPPLTADLPLLGLITISASDPEGEVSLADDLGLEVSASDSEVPFLALDLPFLDLPDVSEDSAGDRDLSLAPPTSTLLSLTLQSDSDSLMNTSLPSTPELCLPLPLDLLLSRALDLLLPNLEWEERDLPWAVLEEALSLTSLSADLCLDLPGASFSTPFDLRKSRKDVWKPPLPSPSESPSLPSVTNLLDLVFEVKTSN